MNNFIKQNLKIIFCCLSAAFLYGCSSQKDNATNRSLQNLSARYNFIYNANVLLNTYQDDLALSHSDNYDGFLPVYIAPPAANALSSTVGSANKSLDEITEKAQTVIAEKGLSNYVDEAYLLLAKTNFYRGNYFTAAAYFDYTSKAFQANNKVYLTSMNWKARSLMQLNNDDLALKVLDTLRALVVVEKKEKAEPLATLAQMSIYQQQYPKAILYLEEAIKESNKVQHKIRWSYILGQLHEIEKNYPLSLKNYTRVEHSNAPFELYFNAKLSKIRINAYLSNQAFNRKEQLLKLLKDDKNIDYIDQIYYEVAEDYLSKKDYTQAAIYYRTAIQKSTRNAYQKGLAYLKLADLNFKNLGNYVDAKLYYDSAANTLPKTYANYDAIVKKSQNLEYLTDRYQLIAAQDTLQLIARLPEQQREKRIAQLFEAQKTTTLPNTASSTVRDLIKTDEPLRTANPGTFYFSNPTVISRGFNDFKKRWGNRILADNWRQSIKSSAQVNQQNQTIALGNTDPGAGAIPSSENTLIEDKIKNYTATLPLTSALMDKSDQLIIDAYFELASFYQQVLEDRQEALKIYELLLTRYPKNNHLDAIYYSLYLEYANSDQQKSAYYKNLILSKYPNSVYAKTILDPNFSTKQNALDVEVNKIYNSIFATYEKKDFPAVIKGVNETNQRFPGNNLQAQYDYLKAIAIGRTSPLDSLLVSFNNILTNYPNDLLITPLVKDHLAYINANLAAFKARKIALTDFDPSEPKFIAQQNNVIIANPKPTDPAVNTTKPVDITSNPVPVIAKVDPPINQPSVSKPEEIKTPILQPSAVSLFSNTASTVYYYVIAVTDMSVSVSSSRFGVGQFNRGNYAGKGLKHQLQELSEDQLIYVGNFDDLEEVKTYSFAIMTQLTRIMKVPNNIYQGFYISKENFDKIKDRQTLNSYLEFFKSNY